MVMVTDRAKTYLMESVPSQIDAPGVCVRLAANSPGELVLVPDTEKEDDEVVELEGATVLLIDGPLSSQLSGTTIDCVESPRGAQLTIQRPNSS
jgi:Fe-S cluster assembly iron-binding protein IscA